MVCPISYERIDTHALRVSGSMLFVFTLLYLIENSIIWLIPVLVELAIRAVFSAKYAPMFVLSKMIINVLRIQPQLEDAAPKQFAVRVGFLMVTLIISFSLLGIDNFAYFISIILLLCIGLEVVFRFCVGCVIYAWLVKIKG